MNVKICSKGGASDQVRKKYREECMCLVLQTRYLKQAELMDRE